LPKKPASVMRRVFALWDGGQSGAMNGRSAYLWMHLAQQLASGIFGSESKSRSVKPRRFGQYCGVVHTKAPP